jgi:hypothetical protein
MDSRVTLQDRAQLADLADRLERVRDWIDRAMRDARSADSLEDIAAIRAWIYGEDRTIAEIWAKVDAMVSTVAARSSAEEVPQ